MLHWSESAWNNIYLPPTRFEKVWTDLPFTRRYTSFLDDAYALGERHKVRNAQEYVALHAVKLHAGQADAPGGESGRHATPDPVLAPELTGGRIHLTHV